MNLRYVAVLSMMMSGSLVAQDVHINGTISQTIKVPATATNTHSRMAVSEQAKEIKLLKVELSDHAKKNLAARTKNFSNHLTVNSSSKTKFPSRIELGMNDVPVLDQGQHGTCVTFATTAAVDAVLNKGDYISQVCQLQLGSYLAENGYGPAGWDGSWGRLVLSQMESFGIVSKEQEGLGCGGVNQYPADSSTPTSFMSLEEYHQVSEPLSEELINWSPILDFVQAFDDRLDPNYTLDGVKASLVKGNRVTFGVLLLDFDLGTMGAVGTKAATNDSWVLTPEIARDVYLRPAFGGHEMIITGYDDNAVAVDDQGRQYKGLLKLRNSWGTAIGDKGDFYMSYDFFKLLVIEAQSIRFIDMGDEE